MKKEIIEVIKKTAKLEECYGGYDEIVNIEEIADAVIKIFYKKLKFEEKELLLKELTPQ